MTLADYSALLEATFLLLLLLYDYYLSPALMVFTIIYMEQIMSLWDVM